MKRKKKAPERENHERWLVSYADFITLLFAFFVVMFAASHADKSKARKVSEAVENALAGNVRVLASGTTTGPKIETGVTDLLPSFRLLSEELTEEIKSGKMRLNLQARGLVVTLDQAAFFPSGADRIDPSTYPSLSKVAKAIQKIPNPIRLEGHTDALPIHTIRFQSNWDLSAARAIAMLEVLTTVYQVESGRLAVAGYAETAPVDTNETDRGRSRNRRVDIVILSRSGATSEPDANRLAASNRKS